MDIGTGKEFGNGVKIWLLGVVEPDEEFSVAHYVKLAQKAIDDVRKRGKLPIIVGGTGLYIKGVVEGIGTLGIPPNWSLRKKLTGWPAASLAGKLRKLDFQKWQKMNQSDRNNPRRLIRAIELATGNKKQEARSKKQEVVGENKNVLVVGLKAPYKFLYKRIDCRVEERIKAGAEAEIKNLLKKYSFENSILGATIAYQEWQPYFERQRETRFPSKARGSYFEGKAGRQEVIQCWKFAEHAYARRQMTWFRRNKQIHWFDISQNKWQDKVESLMRRWYDRDNAQKS